jgi:integrase
MNARRQKYQRGSVYLDPKRKVWVYRWKDHAAGVRRNERLGTLAEIPTKAKALRLAAAFMPAANSVRKAPIITFEAAAQRYMAERMPKRFTTGGGYRNNLEKHVLPQWGAVDLGAVKPLAVDRWFLTLPLAQKTKAHIKSVMRQVFEYAMLCEMFDMQRNPMDLVRVEGGTLTDKDPLILTPEQFGCLIRQIITEPHRTMVLVAMCLGLRRSEIGGLKWSDFDWTKQQVLIQRSVIANRVDAVKTKRSKARLPLDPALIAVLEDWRKISEFKADSDWVWASPFVAGEMPYYLNAVQRDYIIPAGKRAGLGESVGWHTFRHTYRTWMDANGTPLGIQQDLMRHANISMTTKYGSSMAEGMRAANSAVVRMAIQ